MIFVPLLNVFIKNVNRELVERYILILILILGIIPAFSPSILINTELAQFILLYIIGAYLRKNPKNVFSSKRNRNILLVLGFLLLFTSSIVLRCFSSIYSIGIKPTMFYSRTSIIVLVIATTLVATVVYGKIWYNKYINFLGSCTFGVYLFHDNPFIRKIIWTEWMHNNDFCNSKLLVLRMVVSVFVVYGIGIIIELSRQIFCKRMVSISKSMVLHKNKYRI